MPFDNQSFELRDDELGVRAGAAPFAKLVTPVPASESDEVLRCLIEGRALIAKGWCQGPYATNAEGRSVCFSDPGAVNFCSSGALRRTMAALDIRIAAKILLSEATPPGTLSAFSNTRYITYSDARSTTRADMLAMWDRAIAARRSALVS